MLKNLTYLSTFTFIIILSWVAFGIYNNYTLTTISSDTQILITPIPAKFDLDVVNSITSRTVIDADLSTTKVATSQAVITPTTPPAVATIAPTSAPITTQPQGTIPGIILPSPTAAQSTQSANLQL